MARITFGGGRELSLKIAAPIALQKGAGLHRLTFPAEFDARNTIAGGVPVTLNVQVWLGASFGDWLGPLISDDRMITVDGLSWPANLVVGLTDEQLAVIEQRRAGSDLSIWFSGQVVLGYDPGVANGDANVRWPSGMLQETITVLGEVWERLLAQSAAGMSLAVVVPVPLDKSTAGRVGRHLRDAISKVNDGEYGDAVMAARRALDAMGRDWLSEKSVVDTGKEDRSLEQRLGMLRHALHGLASPSAHSDDMAEAIQWDREKALAVIAGVSALVAVKE